MDVKPHRPDLLLTFFTLVLIGFGLIMIYSSSNVEATNIRNDHAYYFKLQAIYAALALVVMAVTVAVPPLWLKKVAFLGFGISWVALALVPFFGIKLGRGVQRSLDLGFITFMPSEMIKPFMVMSAGILLERIGAKIQSFRYLLLAIIPLILVAPLVAYQPDLGTTVVIVGGYGVVLLVGGIRWFYVFLGCGGLAGAFYTMVNFFAYQKDRITVWLDPWSDPLGNGWQIIQSLYAISSGSLWGLRLGQSRQKYGFLPEPMNDFIYAIIAEELGFAGAVVVILLFVLFLWRGSLIALRSPDPFSAIVAAGITTMIVLQALINIAVVTTTLPATGIPLPFISYGGTSLLFTCFATGVLLNLSRYTTP
ncbi:MAG: putative lipid II flippase FtsW [Symbiobacteriaceae bacterium]|nr:putative lipid II flippase FtsW [Symbiobacteriaceae bacterium]